MGLQMALLPKPHVAHLALQAALEAAVLSSSAVLVLLRAAPPAAQQYAL